jgi:hypothetical protein
MYSNACFSELMLIMEVFSAALYLAHPELNSAQGADLLIELSI